MLMFIALAVGALPVVVLASLYIYMVWHHGYWKKRGLITAQPLTLFGSYPGLLTGRSKFMQDVQQVYDKYKGKHRAVGVFFTRQPQILVLDPQLAHDVLVKNFSDFRDSLSSSFVLHPSSNKYIKRRPFFLNGDEWKKRRTEGATGLGPSKLKQAYGIWEQSGNKLLDYMQRHIEQLGQVIETRDLCYRYTADAMGDFLWGIDAGSLTGAVNERSQFHKFTNLYASTIFDHLTLFNKLIVAPVIGRLMGIHLFSEKSDKFFHQLTLETIKVRLSGGNERADYLAYLIQLMEQKGVSHDDLIGHALTALLDGYETSATVLYHMLYQLAEYPAEQSKLRTEILDALSADGNISYEQLASVPYLDQCVNESLRLSSVIGNLSKICSKDTTIDLGNGQTLNVERGTRIMVPAYHFHHDATYYAEPEVFRPERFENDEHVEYNKRGYFLPFGDGPRICMGMRLGLLNVKMALVRILSQFEVQLTRPVPKTFDTVFGTFLEGDIPLKYEKLGNLQK